VDRWQGSRFCAFCGIITSSIDPIIYFIVFMSNLPDVSPIDSSESDYDADFLAQLGCTEGDSPDKIRLAVEQRDRWVAEFKESCLRRGFLNPQEIDELVRFEFYQPAISLYDQVRRYVLKLKDLTRSSGGKAELMQIEADALIRREIKTIADVEALCRILYKYLGGAFTILFDGRSYSVHKGQFGPV